MASEGTDLSTRMSAEDKNIKNKCINDFALTCFKKYKVEISGAITTTFPFLELIRDYGFITNEMYEKYQVSFKKRSCVHEIIYDILGELEKKFEIAILQALFSKIIMDKYRDLYRIYKIFIKEIPDIKFFLKSDGEENEERPNNQLSLEQGTGGNSYQRLMWLGPDACNNTGTALPEHGLSEHCCETQQINVNETGTTTDNNNALESQQGNEQHAQESEHEVINSEDSREYSDRGTVDFGNDSISEKPKKKRRTKMHIDEKVDFNAEILPVTCGEMKGMLIKRKLERGATVKCIRREDGNWFTPMEFEVEGGYEKSSNWKISVCCNGRPLKGLIENGLLPPPPHSRKRKPENSEKCKICGDEGKLFKCSFCLTFFHENCHIPPVEPERKDWMCTFCTTEVSLRSQQHASYSEVLAKRMGREEKSKCVFLLLKIYYHLESNIFRNIPHEHYVQKASQCLEALRTLDEIKNRLSRGCYPKVKGFVLSMNKIFQEPKHNDSILTEEEFKKYFKDAFAIQ